MGLLSTLQTPSWPKASEKSPRGHHFTPFGGSGKATTRLTGSLTEMQVQQKLEEKKTASVEGEEEQEATDEPSQGPCVYSCGLRISGLLL